MTLYAASKWALEGFAEGLAMEVAPFGLEVVVLEPGNYATAFGSKVKVTDPASTPYQDIWRAAQSSMPKLAAISAPVEECVPTLIEALTSPNPRHLWRLGLDAEYFGRLKGEPTFEKRAKLLRRLLGLPGSPRKPSRTAVQRRPPVAP